MGVNDVRSYSQGFCGFENSPGIEHEPLAIVRIIAAGIAIETRTVGKGIVFEQVYGDTVPLC